MNKITQIVENYLSSDLILMDISENTRGNFIRVVIDAERPVTLDDTTNLSKKLRNDDELDIRFPDGFRLEVTTPGLDKGTSLWHSINEKAKEKFSKLYDKNKYIQWVVENYKLGGGNFQVYHLHILSVLL